MKPRGLLAAAGVTTVVLSACGGGGGMMSATTMPMPTSTSPAPMNPMPGSPMNPMNPMNPNPMSVPGEAAVSAFLQTRHESLLHDENRAAALVANLPAAKSGTFSGFAPAYAATHLQSIRSGGEPAVTKAVTHYFLADPYVPLGKVGADGRPFGVVTVTFGIPTTLKAGDSGIVDHLTYFHDAGMQVVDASEVTAYAVEGRDASSLRLCLSSTVSAVTPQGTTDGLAAGTASECYAVNRAGAASLESVSLAGATGNLTLR